MRAWFTAHAMALRSALRRLARHPIATLFEVAVLGVALALPISLFLAVESLRSFVGRHPTEPEISVFMALGAETRELAAVKGRLEKLPDVARVQFVSRQEALGALRKSAGLAEVLDALPENPLPDAFTVRARDGDPAVLERLRAEIAAWPMVALVQLDSAWARKVQAAARAGWAAAAGFAVLFGIAAVAVTFNTVRLQMLDRRDEIALARLIGATNGYIRRPFVYFGALQGFFGGAVALALAAAGGRLLNSTLADFSVAYGTTLEISQVAPEHALSFLGLAALLGGVAAWTAATRQLWANYLRYAV